MANGAAIIGIDYKELPLTWPVKELRQVGRIRYGLGQPPELDEAGVPMIRATNVKRGSISAEGLIRIKREAIPPNREAFLSGDDIIIVRSGAYTGDVARITPEWEGSVAGYDLIVSPGNQLDSQFCSYCLLSRPIQTYFRSQRDRSAQPHLNRQQLETTSIPVPPIPEQRAIARVLGIVQQAKKTTEKVIAATRQLKQSLIQYLFKFGPVPFNDAERVSLKETAIGSIPDRWIIQKLGDVAKIERGKFAYRPRNDPRFYGGDIPFIQTGDVAKSGGRIRAYSQTLNHKGLSISRLFPKGTIVLTIAANIGDVGILEFNSAFPDSLVGITPTCLVTNEFLCLFLFSQKPEMDRLAPRGTQKNINIRFLEPWPVPVPPHEEQISIQLWLQSINNKIEAEDAKRRALIILFDTLLHNLMTGKIRLPEFATGSAK